MKAPTYTATEIKTLAMTLTDPEGMKVLAELINEEIELYSEQDMAILMQASMIVFVRTLIIGSIKLLPL